MMEVSEFLKILRDGENERVEFKRKVTSDIGEEICAMANTFGGVILVGVGDSGDLVGVNTKKARERITTYASSITPPPKISFEVVRLEDKEILVVRVKKSAGLTTIGGVAYVRVGTGKRPLSLAELVSMSAEYVITPLDSLPTGVGEEEMDEGLWKEFLRERRMRGYRDTPELKRKLGVVKKTNGEWHLTLAGLLFFHSEPQQYLPHTYVRVRTPVGWKRVGGPVWKAVQEVFGEVSNAFYRTSEMVGVKRVDVWPLPERAVREALVNALTHRNYAIHSEVFVDVSPTSLTIKNPGGFPPGSTPENPQPVPRNPTLYELMFEVGLVERQGSGIDMMRDLCNKAGVNLKIVSGEMFTTLTFEVPREGLLDEVCREILELLDEGEMSSAELAQKLGLSKPTVLKRLETLISLGIVESVGRGPRRRYRKVS